MAFLQTIFSLFLIILSPVNSKKLCPVSHCGTNYLLDVRYPFRLEGDPFQSHTCDDYIDLKCDSDGVTTINLPFSGDFVVSAIYYYTQRIELSDPENCLAKRLMHLNLSSSLSLLRPFRYLNYTFYTCPKGREIYYQFQIIPCLSNETNTAIASSVATPEYMKQEFGCSVNGSWLIPGTWRDEYHGSETFRYLDLAWNVYGCKDCEVYNSPETDGSKSKLPRFLTSPLFILFIVGLVVLVGVACCLHRYKKMASRNEANPVPNNTAAPITSMPQSTVLATASSLGLEDELKIRSCTVHELLGEGDSDSAGNAGTCTICLEEYHGNETVRFIIGCEHYFHASCIDLWLTKNKTCPVCRTSLSDVKV